MSTSGLGAAVARETDGAVPDHRRRIGGGGNNGDNHLNKARLCWELRDGQQISGLDRGRIYKSGILPYQLAETLKLKGEEFDAGLLRYWVERVE